MLTIAASFESGWDFVALFELGGGMPTRVTIPEQRLDTVIAKINDAPRPDASLDSHVPTASARRKSGHGGLPNGWSSAMTAVGPPSRRDRHGTSARRRGTRFHRRDHRRARSTSISGSGRAGACCSRTRRTSRRCARPSSVASSALKPEFDKRNVKVIGLSVDPLGSHKEWANDIKETQGHALNFPLIADSDKKVANLYGMIHPNASDT